MRTKVLDTFFVRAPRLNQLNILHQIAGNPHLTQAELARNCSLSVAMVNNYMKELCASGLLEYHRKSSRNVSYHLTPSGESFLESHRQKLLQEMVEIFAGTKSRIHELIVGQASGGLQAVVVFGQGHLAELTFHALESAGVSVIGVCSDDPVQFGREWCGRQVLSPSQIRYMKPDAVVIADMQRSHEIYCSLQYLEEQGIRVVRFDSASIPEPMCAPASGPQPAVALEK